MKKIIKSILLAVLLSAFAAACSVKLDEEAYTPPVNVPLDSLPIELARYTLSSNEGDIEALYERLESETFTLSSKQYSFSNGDLFELLRLEIPAGRASAEPARLYKSFEGRAGTYRYLDSETGQWEIKVLEGTLPRQNVYINIDGKDMILIPPLAYSAVEPGSVRAIPENDGTVTVDRHGGVFYFEYEIPLEPGIFADTLLLEVNGEGIDWQSEIMLSIWKGYDLTGANRFLLDGYYYSTPEDYTPSGKDYYWLNPSAYITSSLAISGGSRAAADLSLAMLDILRANVNSRGFFPTLPKSGWLENDYGIGPGFFDTRFNTDIFTAYLIAYQKHGIKEFADMAESYTAFFNSHARDNHFQVHFNEFTGWLVADYSHPDKSSLTHVSLNHQAAEISYLYRYSEVMSDQSAADLAFMLLQGIRYTGEKWIAKDGNLHYAYLPEGSYGLQDYPYLTYNDLFELNRIVTARSDQEDKVLTRLMESKKDWMDSRGITEYRKS